MREQLIDAVENNGEKIKQVAKRLRMNYSSAKSIFQVYKKEGRSNKKVYKRKVHPQENKSEDLASQSIEARQLQESLKAFQNAQMSRQGFHPFWNNTSQLNSEPVLLDNPKPFPFTQFEPVNPVQPIIVDNLHEKFDQMRKLQQQQQQQQQIRLHQMNNPVPSGFPQQMKHYSFSKNILNQNQSQLGSSLIGIGMKDYPPNSINLSQVQSIQPPNFFASLNSANSLPHMNLNNIFHQNATPKNFDLQSLNNQTQMLQQLRRNQLSQSYHQTDPFFLQNFDTQSSQPLSANLPLNPYLKTASRLPFYSQDLSTAKLEPQIKEENLFSQYAAKIEASNTKLENFEM